MKVQVVSDLHCEWIKRGMTQDFLAQTLDLHTGAEVLVVAGDLDNHKHLQETLLILGDLYRHVVYVPGNHEVWGAPAEVFVKRFKKMVEAFDGSNVYPLWDSSVEIEGQKFVGTPLWFPSDPMNAMFEFRWADFQKTKGLSQLVYDWNKSSQEYLMKEMEGAIVVTHHLPLRESLDPDYEGDWSNRFFITDMSEAIHRVPPKMWIHGHTHRSREFVYAGVHVVCNPYGYCEYMVNQRFEPGKVVVL